MFGSTILETAIGLVFVYLVFSLIASAIAEYISSLFERRSEHLKHILFNLFDNDDPQGRTMLNLFVAHPMIQALNTTKWKPEFQSAAERTEQKFQQFDLARNKWDAAAAAVTAADQARAAAAVATSAAARATTAVGKIKDAQQSAKTMGSTPNAALQTAIADGAEAARAANAAAQAAKDAASRATAAGSEVTTVKKWRETPADVAAERLAQRSIVPERPAQNEVPRAVGAVLPIAAAPPAETSSTKPTELNAAQLAALASQVLDQATKAAQAATAAAADAVKAAKAADNAKKGLDSALIDLVEVPKYIPDRTFIDVIIHVLTDDNTIRALSSDRLSQGQQPPPQNGGTTSLWDRFGSALAILGGVASRLPVGDSKNNVTRAIQSVTNILNDARGGAAEALGAVSQLEKGTNDLLAAVAAIPDDKLRSALQLEIQNSLRPLHALGQNLLMLERAGQTISMMADSSIKTALTAFLTQSSQDLDMFKQNVGSWFNDVMDHASGWYKRNTQVILFVIALVLCSVNNVDTVSLVGHLSTNPEMRDAALKEARAMLDASELPQPAVQKVGAEAKPVAPVGNDPVPKKGEESNALAEKYKKALEATKLPLWWSKAELENLWAALEPEKAMPVGDRKFSINFAWILAKITGLAISILAVSMGAPFWFDVLNKLVNVRLVGKRPEPTSDTAVPAQPVEAPTRSTNSQSVKQA